MWRRRIAGSRSQSNPKQCSGGNGQGLNSLTVLYNAEMTPPEVPSPEGPLKKTILLVDDEQSVRAIVLKILRRAKYEVLEAENGEAALRVADSHQGKIDLVITDMFMPGLRGPEVAQKLARTRPGLRVLFISGYADPDMGTALPVGANFLNKPFSGADLAKTVEAALKGPPVS